MVGRAGLEPATNGLKVDSNYSQCSANQALTALAKRLISLTHWETNLTNVPHWHKIGTPNAVPALGRSSRASRVNTPIVGSVDGRWPEL